MRAKKWVCKKCAPFRKGSEIEIGETMRQERGCDRDSGEGLFSWDPQFRGCPNKLFNPWSSFLLGSWEEWNSTGLLPYPGTMADQPYWVAQSIGAIDRAYKIASRKAESAGLDQWVEKSSKPV